MLSMAVNTAKVEGRRKVDYKSLQEVVDDADRLSVGHVKAIGNWSPGQIYRHLAIAFNGSIDGLPNAFPWYMRLMGGLLKNKLLAGPMPSGIKLPEVFAKVVLPPETSDEQGLAELRAAVARLDREPHRAKHPIFGEITKEEWNKAHLGHANLHMSYLIPQ
jgi:Protein of unknown function (DUF1569)